jgi:RNA polymerase sigma-70 factor (ECF subfamily)
MFLRADFRTVYKIEEISEIHQNKLVEVDEINEKELLETIELLPTGYRTVFLLYVVDGYSHKEIAEKLGITEGTSRSQFFKARNFLQQKLKQDYGKKCGT